MDLVKCPFCGKEIESDSFYCDQCGEELKVCLTHGFKKGKICNECGTRLTEAKNADIEPVASVPQATSISPAVTPVQAASDVSQPLPDHLSPSAVETPPAEATTVDAPEKTVRPAASPAEPRSIVCAALNARIDLRDGAVVGRKAGDYIHVFATQGYVSGTHARLQRNGAGQWEVVDLGSSNGTFLNDRRLPADTPSVFEIGDTIAFYDLKFKVE